jgi:hypothetical protein
MDGWRLNLDARQAFRFLLAGVEQDVVLQEGARGLRLDLGDAGKPVEFTSGTEGRLHITLDDRRFEATVVRQGQSLTIFCDGGVERLDLIDPLAAAEVSEAPSGRLTPNFVVAVVADRQRKITSRTLGHSCDGTNARLGWPMFPRRARAWREAGAEGGWRVCGDWC